jgi:monoterpene epsilon-lactone hydrolase
MPDAFFDWGLPRERTGIAASENLVQRRAAVAAAPVDPSIAFERTDIAGVRCLVFRAPRADAGTMLYFHGGGYRMGAPEPWAAYADSLRAATGCTIVVPDYRLAPEHPFPAALHDAAGIYAKLSAYAPVIIAGDSAGAGLAAGLALAVHRAKAPAPQALVLISPMLDLRAEDETYDSRAETDRFFSRTNMLDCAQMYLQGHAADDPLASPLHADAAAFPRTLVLIGGKEVLLGEAIRFADKLARGGKTVTLHVAENSGHVWPMLEARTDAARDALQAMDAFLKAARNASDGAAGQ